MRIYKFSFLTFLALFLCWEGQAAPYFSAESIAFTSIDPPYKEDSEKRQDEIKQIIKLQKNAKANEVEQAMLERHLKMEMIAADVDKNLTRQNNPKLYQMLDRTNEVAIEVTKNIKSHWDVQRPYLVDKRIKALITLSVSASYPSGHTCGGYVAAHVLSMLLPERRQAFFARANEIAQHRILAGMHFPKDIEGGRQVALLIVGGLLQNADFKHDLELAKRELEGK